MKDYYGILGVSSGATEQEIKKAYRSEAKKWHPDVNKGPDAQSKFVEITEAYEMLMNPTTRQQYDNMRSSGYKSYDNSSYEGSRDSRESDFNRARESARQRGREYSSISLDELFDRIFRGAVDLGKTTIMGEKDYTDSLTLGGKLSLGLKGWFSVLLLILTFTGILAPVTIPLLIKMVMISKGKVVGLVPILAGMVLYIPFIIMFVIYVGYSLDILYLYDSQFSTYMVVLLVIAVVLLFMASKTSYKPRFGGGAGHASTSPNKKLVIASIFVVMFVMLQWIGDEFYYDFLFRLEPAVIFLSGVILGPVFGLVTGILSFIFVNFNLSYFMFGFYISNALRLGVLGLVGGLITLDRSFDIMHNEISITHLKKLLIYILLSVVVDIIFVYVTYNILYYGYWNIDSNAFKAAFTNAMFRTIIILPSVTLFRKCFRNRG